MKMKNYNIIVTGCSYSQKSGVRMPYPNLLNELPNYSVTNLAWPGQSNDTIIRNVKEEIRKGVTNTLFICQLTHLHRISKFCNVNKKWLDFQPAIVNPQPIIKDDKVEFEIKFFTDEEKRPPYGANGGTVSIYGASSQSDLKFTNELYLKLLEWYETYLVYLYDEEHEFYELHHKIDELTSQIKNSGNEILYLYWPDTIYNTDIFKKNNFLSIDGDYSMMKWSVKNNLTQKNDSHLTIDGHHKLLKHILLHLGDDTEISLPLL